MGPLLGIIGTVASAAGGLAKKGGQQQQQQIIRPRAELSLTEPEQLSLPGDKTPVNAASSGGLLNLNVGAQGSQVGTTLLNTEQQLSAPPSAAMSGATGGLLQALSGPTPNSAPVTGAQAGASSGNLLDYLDPERKKALLGAQLGASIGS